MKLIKRLLLVLIVLAAALAAISQFLPGHYQIERNLIIEGSADRIYPYVNNLKQWQAWSAWTTAKDPTLVFSYEGPEEGVGAISKWESKKSGDGQMTITESDPAKGVKFDLNFGHGQFLSKASIRFAPAGTATKVIWGFEGDLSRNPMHRWFGVFMEHFAAPDFEEGLKGLKKAVEKK